MVIVFLFLSRSIVLLFYKTSIFRKTVGETVVLTGSIAAIRSNGQT